MSCGVVALIAFIFLVLGLAAGALVWRKNGAAIEKKF